MTMMTKQVTKLMNKIMTVTMDTKEWREKNRGEQEPIKIQTESPNKH